MKKFVFAIMAVIGLMLGATLAPNATEAYTCPFGYYQVPETFRLGDPFYPNDACVAGEGYYAYQDYITQFSSGPDYFTQFSSGPAWQGRFGYNGFNSFNPYGGYWGGFNNQGLGSSFGFGFQNNFGPGFPFYPYSW